MNFILQNFSQADLKKAKIKLNLLTDSWYVINGIKVIRWGIFHSIFRYAKGDNKCIKVISSILECK